MAIIAFPILAYVVGVQAEIELRWMRMVVAVAEERSFTRASERCHISQPALSRRVSEVESVLGTRLFERHTRQVRVTQAGHLFVREARRTLEQSQRAVSLVQAFAKSSPALLSIGLSALADPTRLHTLIEQSARSVVDLSLVTRVTTTPELLHDLQRGDLDLAIVDLPARVRGIRFLPLFTEPLVAVLPERSSRSRQSAIALTELMRFPLTLLSESVDPSRTVIDHHLAQARPRAFRVHDAATVSELLDEVAIQNRAGLLSQSASRFQRQGVVYKTLSEVIQVGCALAWRADDRRQKLLSFRDALATFARQP